LGEKNIINNYKNNKFSISSYKNLITAILANDRQVINFNDILMRKQGIVMRHDIDFCPIKANKLAIIEAEYNIKSIYFVLIKTGIYNFFQNDNLNALKNILSLGHDIGLHFDPTYYDNKENLDIACKKECEILESILKININIVSFHRPEKKYIGLNKKIGDRIHTYMPDFVKKTKYCSDSQGEWKFENPYDIIADNNIKNIQLLTHPIWWTTPSKLNSGEKVAYHLKDATHEQHKLAAENCRPYKLFRKKGKIKIEE
jgi:hypothetical protein